jgi:diguanylate cyclase (GGDEF)-like protein
VAQRIAELARYGRRFGLLIADIDRFKLVNDRHGHAAGDTALRTVSRALLEATQATDDIARFGGEEFVLTITDVNEDPLRGIAERFRVLVERSQVRVGGRDLRITISLGGTIAEVGEAAETIFERADAALYRADAALYRAKEDGRNRVVMAVNAEASSPSA